MTLIEILVVMCIITSLAGMVIIGAFAASRWGQVKATTALLEKLAQSLEQYKAQNRMYPPVDPLDTVSPLNLNDAEQVKQSTFVLWVALERDGNFFKDDTGAKAPGDAFHTWYYYQDKWNRPLVYLCRPPFNLFKLTSYGPDLVQGTGDDIVKEP